MKMQCIYTIATFRALAVPAVSRLGLVGGISRTRAAGKFGGGIDVPIPGDACVRKRRAKK